MDPSIARRAYLHGRHVGVRNVPHVAATADHRQADYFVRLLNERRREIEQRIDKYRKAVVAAEADGDLERCHALRRTARGEEQDRQALDGLILKLQRRFQAGTPHDATAPTREVPAPVR